MASACAGANRQSCFVQVCECVVILRNLKEVSWAGAKSMMADTGFLKGLVEFDKDSLSDKQVHIPWYAVVRYVLPPCLPCSCTATTHIVLQQPYANFVIFLHSLHSELADQTRCSPVIEKGGECCNYSLLMDYDCRSRRCGST